MLDIALIIGFQVNINNIIHFNHYYKVIILRNHLIGKKRCFSGTKTLYMGNRHESTRTAAKCNMFVRITCPSVDYKFV